MSEMNFVDWKCDFLGHDVYTATQADNAPVRIKDTSSSGTPTYALVASGGNGGELKVDFDNTSEIQNVCLYQSDILQFSVDKIMWAEFRVKMNQAAINAASTFTIGVTGARNDAIASITERALFRLLGSTSTTGLLLDAADGTNSVTGKVSGETLINAYKTLRIDFSQGKSDIRFFVDGVAVGLDNTFSLGAITSSLQFFSQIQKTADTNVDGFTIDYAWIRCRR